MEIQNGNKVEEQEQEDLTPVEEKPITRDLSITIQNLTPKVTPFGLKLHLQRLFGKVRTIEIRKRASNKAQVALVIFDEPAFAIEAVQKGFLLYQGQDKLLISKPQNYQLRNRFEKGSDTADIMFRCKSIEVGTWSGFGFKLYGVPGIELDDNEKINNSNFSTFRSLKQGKNLEFHAFGELGVNDCSHQKVIARIHCGRRRIQWNVYSRKVIQILKPYNPNNNSYANNMNMNSSSRNPYNGSSSRDQNRNNNNNNNNNNMNARNNQNNLNSNNRDEGGGGGGGVQQYVTEYRNQDTEYKFHTSFKNVIQSFWLDESTQSLYIHFKTMPQFSTKSVSNHRSIWKRSNKLPFKTLSHSSSNDNHFSKYEGSEQFWNSFLTVWRFNYLRPDEVTDSINGGTGQIWAGDVDQHKDKIVRIGDQSIPGLVEQLKTLSEDYSVAKNKRLKELKQERAYNSRKFKGGASLEGSVSHPEVREALRMEQHRKDKEMNRGGDRYSMYNSRNNSRGLRGGRGRGIDRKLSEREEREKEKKFVKGSVVERTGIPLKGDESDEMPPKPPAHQQVRTIVCKTFQRHLNINVLDAIELNNNKELFEELHKIEEVKQEKSETETNSNEQQDTKQEEGEGEHEEKQEQEQGIRKQVEMNQVANEQEQQNETETTQTQQQRELNEYLHKQFGNDFTQLLLGHTTSLPASSSSSSSSSIYSSSQNYPSNSNYYSSKNINSNSYNYGPNHNENRSKRLFVGNLEFQCSEQELYNVFGRESDEVVAVQVHRGFGFVIMKSFEEAERLKNLFHKTKKIGDRFINVEFSNSDRDRDRDRGRGGSHSLRNSGSNPSSPRFGMDRNNNIDVTITLSSQDSYSNSSNSNSNSNSVPSSPCIQTTNENNVNKESNKDEDEVVEEVPSKIENDEIDDDDIKENGGIDLNNNTPRIEKEEENNEKQNEDGQDKNEINGTEDNNKESNKEDHIETVKINNEMNLLEENRPNKPPEDPTHEESIKNSPNLLKDSSASKELNTLDNKKNNTDSAGLAANAKERWAGEMQREEQERKILKRASRRSTPEDDYVRSCLKGLPFTVKWAISCLLSRGLCFTTDLHHQTSIFIPTIRSFLLYGVTNYKFKEESEIKQNSEGEADEEDDDTAPEILGINESNSREKRIVWENQMVTAIYNLLYTQSERHSPITNITQQLIYQIYQIQNAALLKRDKSNNLASFISSSVSGNASFSTLSDSTLANENSDNLRDFEDNEEAVYFCPHPHSRDLSELPDYCDMTYSVLITPTRQITLPPTPELSNRVIRHYSRRRSESLSHRFVRVSFVEENLKPLYIAGFKQKFRENEVVEDKIREIVFGGLTIPGIYNYEMLAFSSSQLREKSCWFIAQSAKRNFTVEIVQKWMGDFSKEKIPAKYAARMGQCFSSSMIGVPKEHITNENIIAIPDVVCLTYPINRLNPTPKEDDHSFRRRGDRRGDRNPPVKVREVLFSDGVGVISYEMALEVMVSLGLELCPSAFQIRFGGCKGVVTLEAPTNYLIENGLASSTQLTEGANGSDDNHMAKHPTRYVKLRPSMKKFFSEHYDLEIISWSKPLSGFLNVQMITVLSSLGVPDSHFTQLHWAMLHDLLDMMKKPEIALSILRHKHYSDNEFFRKDTQNASYHKMIEKDNIEMDTTDEANAPQEKEAKPENLSNVMEAMIEVGFFESPFKIDPWLRRMLKTNQWNQLNDLKWRANIFVPKSRVAIGVMDEYKVLKENEIFFQYSELITNNGYYNNIDFSSNNNSNRTEVPKIKTLTGQVILAKNPVLHPGDIRKFQCISNPAIQKALGHLVDVVVFPQVGKRPHTNELSGSDLDGDLYFICWDPDLIFVRENFPAMSYDAPSPSLSHSRNNNNNNNSSLMDPNIGNNPSNGNGVVEMGDIKKFYVDYMIHDTLGAIANNHVAWADQSENGVFDPKCIKLAELHSVAVDFPKSGIAAFCPMDLYPNMFPDFRKRKGKRVIRYESEKVLGNMFRNVAVPNWNPKDNSAEDEIIEVDVDLFVKGWEKYEKRGLELKRKFNWEMNGLMNQYGIGSEEEMITGRIMKAKGRKKDKRWMNVMRVLAPLVDNLKKKYEKKFFDELWPELEGDEDTEPTQEDYEIEMRRKASAWYIVTYDIKYRKEEKAERVLLSFPWDHV